MPQYSSFPYFDIARLHGVDYGLVLHYASVLERPGGVLSADQHTAVQMFHNGGPTGSAIRYALQQEQERRQAKYGGATVTYDFDAQP